MADGIQLDLFGEVEAKLTEGQRRAKARRLATLDCCTGEPCPCGGPHPGQTATWTQVKCGRCGGLDSEFGMSINHDLGYSGCPRDRRWNEAEGRAPCEQPNPWDDLEAWMNDRHDNAHHAMCGCGHAWGLHGRWGEVREDQRCLMYCGCRGYVPAPHNGSEADR